MFNIQIDTKAVERKLIGMIEKIDHLTRVDLGNELGDWQVENMHRNKPFVMRSRARGKATTVIRPHSLYEVEHSAQYQHGAALYERRLARRLTRAKNPLRLISHLKHFEPRTSTRPFLRPELEAELVDRMTTLLAEKLKW